ncbi:major facilitator superfamily domain-containing protein 4A-like [Ruditapes philippinarum]|uniref:major facilitator superfamily domain-containing protein 4A-like n=1 Tax=Ruditapes philippinarum TaxID=129788 RepID=UPI00295A9D41|nr:major facilitator superfamily domain-containing protein 4A-like [Ruditapes philippinarum]XP_060582131.1 major facilitator superfamily domain-containing protein 4A-like [Ruditapes philippinarum]XP_060582132.1 major facilitator superfamily domain-containing protein 4A-like [Ruditapes philippinarum]
MGDYSTVQEGAAPQTEVASSGVILGSGDASPSTDEKISFWKLFKKHKLSVLVDCLVFGIFGMGVAFLGPTLFDLGCQTNSDLKQMNWVFFVQLLMTMIGSISAGYLTGRFVPAHILLCIGMTGLPITMFLIPACRVLAELLINLMVMGWFMGCVDCVANLRMILRFDTNVTPFLQAMHFFYGLGAFISPMIASPFLLNIDCSPFIDGYTITPPEHSAGNQSVTINPQPKVVNRAMHLSHSKEAFFILGSIQIVITFIVYIVVWLEKKWGILYSPTSSPSVHHAGFPGQTADGSDFTEYSGSRSFTRYFRCGSKDIVIITALTSASLFMYDGIQSSYADYIYSYAEKNVDDLERSEGAVLNSCFWGPFALGRLIAVILSTRLSAAFMLSCNLGGCSIALLLTLIFKTSRVAVYIGTCALGLFLSSMSPTAMALTEQFISINAPITSCMVVFAALGETICPVIVGNLFVTAGPVSFLAFCFTVVIIGVAVYVLLMVVGRNSTKYRETSGVSFVWLTKPPPRFGENSEINNTNVKYYSNQDQENNPEMTSKSNEDAPGKPIGNGYSDGR